MISIWINDGIMIPMVQAIGHCKTDGWVFDETELLKDLHSIVKAQVSEFKAEENNLGCELVYRYRIQIIWSRNIVHYDVCQVLGYIKNVNHSIYNSEAPRVWCFHPCKEFLIVDINRDYHSIHKSKADSVVSRIINIRSILAKKVKEILLYEEGIHDIEYSRLRYK